MYIGVVATGPCPLAPLALAPLNVTPGCSHAQALGGAHAALGELEEAAGFLEKAVKLGRFVWGARAAESAALGLGLGEAYLGLGLGAEAVPLLADALDVLQSQKGGATDPRTTQACAPP